MSFAVPWALLGLLALPLVWWLHRRLRRPPVVELPSLMFLQDEEEAHALPRGRRIDAELLLALGAGICLVLGAAGLQVTSREAGRHVRVVVAGGGPAQATGYRGRVERALATVRAAMEDNDRLEVVREPPGDERGRPTSAALLAAARTGSASLRVVVSDEAPDADPGDVAWVSVGDPQAVNVGIVAVRVVGQDEDTRVFCNVLNDSASEARFHLVLNRGDDANDSLMPRSDLAPHALASTEIPVRAPGRAADRLTIELEGLDAAPWRDALPLDDRVVLTREPLPVFVSPALPAAHRDRVGKALVAALTREGIALRAAPRDAVLAVVTRGEPHEGAAWVLELEPVGEGDAVERAPPGSDAIGRDPLVRDLATAGVEWVYRAGAQRLEDDEQVLLARGAEGDWPVVLRSGRRVRLAPDPLRGEPAAADGPFWPLLIDNLVGLAGGQRGAGAGYRAEGLLDVRASSLGRTWIPFDPSALEAARPLTAAGRVRPLRPWLAVGALALLAMLWAAPWLRRRLAGAPQRANPHEARA